MARVIEYYYALASPWSYLGNDKLTRIAEQHGLEIDPIIIDYDHMFEASGTIPLPQRPPLRKAYRLIELKRWGAFRGVPINPQPRFYRGEVEEPDERLGALMVVAAKDAGLDSLRLAHAVQRALWAEERFPFTVDELGAIASAEGFDGPALLQAAADPEVAEMYRGNTARSIARRVFGMPFYIVDEQPFWGQDRLELLEWSLRSGSE
ncbi:MAG: 2-hydroxychromene-2-carboxylate isomerase [Hyphomicrobiaceae bacterium]